MEKGAHIKEISGGVFRGKNDAVHLTDDSRQGTSIDRISGGEFYQTQTESGLHGVALFVQNYARVGEISGGYFEAARNQALTVIRGGRIDEVSGGEFTTKRTGTYVAQIYNSEASYPTSSIGTISGGYFHGGDYGIWSIGRNGDGGTEIGSITGGKFESKTSLQNDSHSVIGSISGGTFTGEVRGIFNAGDIEEISGTAEVVGNGDSGIYNYMGGTIGEISGGTIIATYDIFSEALVNSGTIDLISGGTIIGEWSAINSEYGKIDTISDGVFWSKNSFAICVGQALKLEPGLGESSRKGMGRYQSGGGQPIFDNEKLVAYPVNPQLNIPWSMSSANETEAVAGIPDVGFRYLALPVWDLMYDANIPGGSDGSAVVLPGSQMGIDANNASAAVGSPKGTPTGAAVTYGFAGWNTQTDGLGTTYKETDAVPAQPDGTVVTLYAQWTQKPVTTCAIVYNGNGNTGGEVPVDVRSPYARGSIVTILGRNNMTKENYTFKGWATTAAGEVEYAPAQTFSIAADTTLYAVWKSNASPKTGEGSNMTGWIVALVASALGMLSIFLWYKRRQRKGMKQ
jgi:uncharacterized repeat protein (TIGR02543 family)